ncbi:MAG TPA: hypothetical protein VK820_00865 [Steroidobacteraceae bacterium]|nr:hypothetical protein [Steroidobacteraceae bacterium]
MRTHRARAHRTGTTGITTLTSITAVDTATESERGLGRAPACAAG